MNNTSSNPNQNVATGALIALIIATTITGYFMVLKKTEIDDIYDTVFTAYPNTLAPASRSESAEVGQLQKIMALYESKDYKNLIKQINSYLSTNPADYQLKFYRGVAYLELDDAGKATKDFEDVLLLNRDLKDQAEWYLALSYLKLNDKEKAFQIFNGIAQSGNSYSGKAKEIIAGLNFTPTGNQEKFYQITADGKFEFYLWKEENPVQHPVTERTLYLEASRLGLIPGDISYTAFTKLTIEEKRNILTNSQQEVLTAMENSKRDLYNEIQNSQADPDLSALAMLEQEKLEQIRHVEEQLAAVENQAKAAEAETQETPAAEVEEITVAAVEEVPIEEAKEPTYEQPKKIPNELKLPWIIDAMLRTQAGTKLPDEFEEIKPKEEEASWIVEAVTNPSADSK